ncbi:hypothetical protein ACFE04_013320 [Oxalis oulophora]
MGAVPSTPLPPSPTSPSEYLFETLVGEKSFPIGSDFWQKLLLLPPISLRSSTAHILHAACRLFAQNNSCTRHLAKVLIHLTWSLQEAMSNSGAYTKAVNAAYISSVFFNYLIENSGTEYIKDLCLSLDQNEPVPEGFVTDQNVENLVLHSVLTFIGSVEVRPDTYLLHQELLGFILVGMATQLLSGTSPRPIDVHPFINAAMAQDISLICSVVHRLLLNYIERPRVPSDMLTEGNQPGVLKRVGSAAATFVLSPLNHLVHSGGDGSRSLLADYSLNVLLVLIHYPNFLESNDSLTDRSDDSPLSKSPSKLTSHFTINPYYNALNNARDTEFDRLDVEQNAHSGPLVRLPFASLFDTLGMCLSDETAVLLLYSLIHGNSDFLEYVLVRTDLDTLVMPLLETLYNAVKKMTNQMYMVLIVLLILSQDSSFNASIHKMMLPGVPWYKEQLLRQTSLGSLMVVILVRTVNYNLSKLRDVYLHTTCLAVLANMAPHVHRLSAYASQRLVSLFYMLSHKYNKLAKFREDKIHLAIEPDNSAEDKSAELQIYTDFLRIVLEILNAILTYGLPQNPEVVYAIMHRQDVFQPFKNHPRFGELVENICTVLNFFNSRLDAQNVVGGIGLSAEKVLQFIISNSRSWRGEGMKMFTQLHFSYEQESRHEEFFIPYVWQLVLSRCGMCFIPGQSAGRSNFADTKQMDHQGEEFDKCKNGGMKGQGLCDGTIAAAISWGSLSIVQIPPNILWLMLESSGDLLLVCRSLC